jgi:predicted HTH transcriptional regulator
MRSQIPVSRINDPASSHEAEVEVNRSGVRRAHQEIILSTVRRHPGRTSKELTEFCNLDRYQIARRLADLEKVDLVAKGRMRVCTMGNRSAVTWYVKPSIFQREQMELF